MKFLGRWERWNLKYIMLAVVEDQKPRWLRKLLDGVERGIARVHYGIVRKSRPINKVIAKLRLKREKTRATFDLLVLILPTAKTNVDRRMFEELFCAVLWHQQPLTGAILVVYSDVKDKIKYQRMVMKAREMMEVQGNFVPPCWARRADEGFDAQVIGPAECFGRSRSSVSQNEIL